MKTYDMNECGSRMNAVAILEEKESTHYVVNGNIPWEEDECVMLHKGVLRNYSYF